MILRRALRYSNWDALLVALSIAHGAALLVIPSFPLIAIGLWWNSNTISHNFVHLPFFRSRLSNRVYALYLSLLLGIPQSLWCDLHLAHHAGRPHRVRITNDALIEAGAVLVLWGGLAASAPHFFLSVYLPGYAAGLTLCYIHGYFEHAGGVISHYSWTYNIPFLNDGFHAEHHSKPSEHWSRLPQRRFENARTSRLPAVLRWLELLNLEMLERIVLCSTFLQHMLLRTHERALRRLLSAVGRAGTVKIVGGGMFPRSAILIRKLFPGAHITIVDASAENLDTAKSFLEFLPDGLKNIRFTCERFRASAVEDADLLVIPLCFDGSRAAIYSNPPTTYVLVHDWIWSRQAASVIVSPWLLKRMNLVRR